MLDQSPSLSYEDKRHASKRCKIINLIKRLNHDTNDNTLIIFKGVHHKKTIFFTEVLLSNYRGFF